ncbi:MAG: serine hydrolase domain-containing protein [Massilia sp.]
MVGRVRRLASLTLLAASGAAVAGTAPPPDADALSRSLGRAFVAQSQHVGLSIGVIQGGDQKQFHFGTTDRTLRHAPGPDTIYELASLTKTYTGLLLATAVLEHKLALDDDVRRFLPPACQGLSFNGRAIRLVDLANHTAGLPKNVPAFVAGATPPQLLKQLGVPSREQFLAQLCSGRLEHPRGDGFAYSNAGSQLLGIVLEQVYGSPYDELIKRFFRVRLTMRDTVTEVRAEDLPRVAMRYDARGVAMPGLSFWAKLPAAAYLKSTIDDQLRYLRWNLDESDPVVALAHRVSYRGTDERGDDIGLAWFVGRQHGQRLVRHAGGSFGSTSYEALYPDAGIALVLLANDADPATERSLIAIADQLAAALLAGTRK